MWGVRGRALSHPRPLICSGVLPGPTTHWLWVRLVRAWGSVTNPTARALTSWPCALGGGMRVPGGGASCLRVGRPGSGALPPPTSHPFRRAAGAHYPLAVGAGGAGAETRHQPHSARTGDKEAPLSLQTLGVRKQLQRNAEAPASAPTQTQLSTGEVIDVSKQDEQGNKCTLTARRIEDIEETPPARFRDLQYPLWVVKAWVLVEFDSAGFVPKWLFDVTMLGKGVIFYGGADVVHRIGRDMQRLWRMEKDKDPTAAPLYHARLPVYSWLSLKKPAGGSRAQRLQHRRPYSTSSFTGVFRVLPT